MLSKKRARVFREQMQNGLCTFLLCFGRKVHSSFQAQQGRLLVHYFFTGIWVEESNVVATKIVGSGRRNKFLRWSYDRELPQGTTNKSWADCYGDNGPTETICLSLPLVCLEHMDSPPKARALIVTRRLMQQYGWPRKLHGGGVHEVDPGLM